MEVLRHDNLRPETVRIIWSTAEEIPNLAPVTTINSELWNILLVLK